MIIRSQFCNAPPIYWYTWLTLDRSVLSPRLQLPYNFPAVEFSMQWSAPLRLNESRSDSNHELVKEYKDIIERSPAPRTIISFFFSTEASFTGAMRSWSHWPLRPVRRVRDKIVVILLKSTVWHMSIRNSYLHNQDWHAWVHWGLHFIYSILVIKDYEQGWSCRYSSSIWEWPVASITSWTSDCWARQLASGKNRFYLLMRLNDRNMPELCLFWKPDPSPNRRIDDPDALPEVCTINFIIRVSGQRIVWTLSELLDRIVTSLSLHFSSHYLKLQGHIVQRWQSPL